MLYMLYMFCIKFLKYVFSAE